MKSLAVPASTLALVLATLAGSALGWTTNDPSPYATRFWQADDGLAHNEVLAVAQTADGYLWCGTSGGISRFDGTQFDGMENTGLGAIKGESVRELCTIPGQRALFIAATRLGLFRFEDGDLKRVFGLSRKDDRLVCAHASKDGSIWVGTLLGLVHCKDGIVTRINETNLVGFTIRSIAEHPVSGDLWLATTKDLVCLRNSHVVTNFAFAEGDFFGRAMCFDENGDLWIGSNAGLGRFKDGRFTMVPDLKGKAVCSIYQDRRHTLWVGTFDGLFRRVGQCFVEERTSGGDPFDQVFRFYEDRENNLWAGTKEGLCRMDVRRCTSLTRRDGLAHNNIMSVSQDASGAIWIGTWGGGLHRWQDGQMTVYSTENTKILKNNFVLGIRETRDGSLWFGEDYDGGLYRLKNGAISRFGQENGYSSTTANRDILEDREGTLWVATSYGLYARKGDKFRAYYTKQGLPANAVRCLCLDSDGSLWIGTEGGLSHFQGGKFSNFTATNGLSDNGVLSLYRDPAGTVWIGTRRGLNRLKDRQITSYTTREGLFDNTLLTVLEDDQGWLWMSSYRGISCVEKKALDDLDRKVVSKVRCAAFGKTDGMPTPVCVGAAKPSACKSRDGRLWFATTKGVAIIDPRLSLERNEVAPPVFVERFLVDGAKVALQQIATEIPPSKGELEFQYAALSFRLPEKNRYKYKLEGVDSDWVDAGMRQTAYYTKIPPGRYRFCVTGCNNDGVWNPTGASVDFVLLPHFWQTWWFMGGCAVAAIGAIGGSVRQVTRRKLQRKLELLQQQHAVEKERTRIAQDMHDDLGASLTEILLLSECALKSNGGDQANSPIAEVVSVAREVVRNLDGIVWAVNPQNDSLEKLVGYIHEYAEVYLKRSSIRCWLDAPERLPDYSLSSEVRHNIFLTVKEALHNAVKYSEASELRINLKLDGSALAISIADNGKGFSVDQVSSFGNGLQNMRKRMDDIGGTFALSSKLGQGTRIELHVPLKPAKAKRTST